ncbi:four helix bundle protein [Hymenobacter chitinivorans]|uniref:Four helix bundle protein n=1 Tax=Hymenobacter chitinivorans DSM 11115 TaxID=1121954 RepID=A0A2M9AST3_9BACT|nr:four helix bundle protein [Hymenobacter chitinivorans]PJJ48754.1 four helix bundle protein [Hymenobacter chitinivorans DSM 11115]
MVSRHHFRELKIWHKAMLITKLTYQCSAAFPSDERFGLTSQIRRAAVSIPSNIAEGSGRGSVKDFSQFLSIATGSAYELETQLILAAEFGYLDETRLQSVLDELAELQRMLYGFQKSLQPEN